MESFADNHVSHVIPRALIVNARTDKFFSQAATVDAGRKKSRRQQHRSFREEDPLNIITPGRLTFSP